MRTTDDLQEPEKHLPLGPPIKKPEPAKPEWTQVPGAAEGVQQNREGKLRTDPNRNMW